MLYVNRRRTGGRAIMRLRRRRGRRTGGGSPVVHCLLPFLRECHRKAVIRPHPPVTGGTQARTERFPDPPPRHPLPARSLRALPPGPCAAARARRRRVVVGLVQRMQDRARCPRAIFASRADARGPSARPCLVPIPAPIGPPAWSPRETALALRPAGCSRRRYGATG